LYLGDVIGGNKTCPKKQDCLQNVVFWQQPL
jgi:hypothetical protein